MDTVKVVLNNGNEVIVPLVNIENFRRIFFHDIAEVIYPDSKGNFRAATKKVSSDIDVSKLVASYKAEIDALTKENDELKEALDKLNSIVDTTVEKTAKSKTKKTK